MRAVGTSRRSFRPPAPLMAPPRADIWQLSGEVYSAERLGETASAVSVRPTKATSAVEKRGHEATSEAEQDAVQMHLAPMPGKSARGGRRARGGGAQPPRRFPEPEKSAKVGAACCAIASSGSWDELPPNEWIVLALPESPACT